MAHRNINMEYVNVPKTPSSSSNDQKWLRLVLLSFGLLCILQATLNVTLRIFLSADTNALDLDGTCKNFTVKKKEDFAPFFQDNWVYFNTSLYYISTAKRNWENSRRFCMQRNADLIVINSKQEQELVRTFHRFMWIGLTMTQGKWMWVDNTPLTTSYWGPGEPSMNLENEDCVESRFFEVEHTWNDLKCEDINFWMCEKTVPL